LENLDEGWKELRNWHGRTSSPKSPAHSAAGGENMNRTRQRIGKPRSERSGESMVVGCTRACATKTCNHKHTLFHGSPKRGINFCPTTEVLPRNEARTSQSNAQGFKIAPASYTRLPRTGQKRSLGADVITQGSKRRGVTFSIQGEEAIVNAFKEKPR